MVVRHASPEVNGARLRELRQELGLSVTQAAGRIGISFGYLAAIERGARRTVAPAMFNHICTVLGVDRSELLLRSENTEAA